MPFQPHVADLEVVVGWFLSLKESLQERVIFLPNRLNRTKEQRDGLSELKAVIAEEGRGQLVEGLSNLRSPARNNSAKNALLCASAQNNIKVATWVKVMTEISRYIIRK